MVLNERKIRILEAIITDYIDTAEPIGSRTIAKKYDMGISSATIRNEMSDLEDLGLIVQPHASAGRVPSDKGYRLYVDNIMPKKRSTTEATSAQTAHLRQLVVNHINQVDLLMREIASSIAMLTKYITVVSEPRFQRTLIRHVQLVPLDERAIVAVVVTDSGVVKNHIVPVESYAPQELAWLSDLLSKRLAGHGAMDIQSGLFDDVKNSVISAVLPAVASGLRNEDERRVYTGGVKNVLAFPEFNNIEKARRLFHTLEEREILITLLDTERGEDDIQVVIGSENSVAEMKDCSIIKASYHFGGENYGAIGIIGPTRMDYVQTMTILGFIVKNINAALGAMRN